MANIPDSPITRKEKYLDAIANGTTEVPEPITREEEYLAWIALNGGGGGGGTGEVTGVKGSAESTFRKGNVSISPANIGLDKVNNTPDLNKPISNATQSALDLKVDKVEGKVLSDNNYSDDDKAIVDGVETELAKKVNKVTGKGLSANDYTNTDKAIVDGVTAALADKADKTDVIDGASYDSANHLILFKRGTDTLFSLDAAAFVKDGMVDTVEITGGNLVITFNTDAGKQAISIPLTDIFDPSNYYNKTATDNLLADKAEQEEVNDIVNALVAKNILNPSWLYNNSALTITPAYDVYGNLKKYTLDGTVTGNQVSILFARRAAKTLTLEAGTSWIFSIGNTLPSGGSMQVGYTHPTTGEWTLLKSQRADKLAFTVPDEAEGMYWTIQIVINDLTFDGYDIFPMLRPSFIEDDTYAPFARANRDLTREIDAMPQKVFTTPNTLLSTTNDANDFQCGFTRCSDANANLPTTGSGSSVLWYDILTIRQSNNPSSELWGYGFQLAIQTTTTATQSDTYVRAVNGGATPVWGAWKKLTT